MTVKDGVSSIANEIINEVQKEAEALILEAENQAKETLRIAKEQADQNYRDILTQASIKAEAEKRKIASVTDVEMRNHLLQTKEDLVDEAFEKALLKLRQFVKTEEYHNYLPKLVEKIAKKIGQKNLVVQVNKSDQNLLTNEIMKRLSNKLHVELNLSEQAGNFIGGCIIQTADGKIIYDSTIDNRLREMKPTLRVEVAKILFGTEN
jgi:V/A-type H+-transporting ATPase subunit E